MLVLVVDWGEDEDDDEGAKTKSSSHFSRSESFSRNCHWQSATSTVGRGIRRDMRPITICLINQKGGCGKSSTCFNLAGHFAQTGQRVLLIDADPQGSPSSCIR